MMPVRQCRSPSRPTLVLNVYHHLMMCIRRSFKLLHWLTIAQPLLRHCCCSTTLSKILQYTLLRLFYLWTFAHPRCKFVGWLLIATMVLTWPPVCSACRPCPFRTGDNPARLWQSRHPNHSRMSGGRSTLFGFVLAGLPSLNHRHMPFRLHYGHFLLPLTSSDHVHTSMFSPTGFLHLQSHNQQITSLRWSPPQVSTSSLILAIHLRFFPVPCGIFFLLLIPGSTYSDISCRDDFIIFFHRKPVSFRFVSSLPWHPLNFSIFAAPIIIDYYLPYPRFTICPLNYSLDFCPPFLQLNFYRLNLIQFNSPMFLPISRFEVLHLICLLCRNSTPIKLSHLQAFPTLISVQWMLRSSFSTNILKGFVGSLLFCGCQGFEGSLSCHFTQLTMSSSVSVTSCLLFGLSPHWGVFPLLLFSVHSQTDLILILTY